jgi:hypothetical protein
MLDVYKKKTVGDDSRKRRWDVVPRRQGEKGRCAWHSVLFSNHSSKTAPFCSR